MPSTQPSDLEQLTAIKNLVAAAPTADAALDQAMAYLHANRQDYHWVGIYRLAGDVLNIGPYRGPVTDHARIKVGQGVCGTAVAENRNQVVADVRAFMGDKVYETVIPRNVRVSEAPSHGKPVLLYDLKCTGSQAYLRLASEVIQRERVLRAA